jgi:hypothetical protein
MQFEQILHFHFVSFGPDKDFLILGEYFLPQHLMMWGMSGDITAEN